MKVLTQIKSWFDASVLFEAEVEVDQERYALRATLELAVRSKINLNRASLDGASLDGAFLNRAFLDGASLNRAFLNGAFLNGASLNEAFLNGAKVGNLTCLSDLSDAIDLAPMVFQEWSINGLEAARNRFGMHKISGEDRALVFMSPFLTGGYCLVLERREIWWWSFRCPNPDTVPVLWREGQES